MPTSGSFEYPHAAQRVMEAAVDDVERWAREETGSNDPLRAIRAWAIIALCDTVAKVEDRLQAAEMMVSVARDAIAEAEPGSVGRDPTWADIATSHRAAVQKIATGLRAYDRIGTADQMHGSDRHGSRHG